MRSAFPYGHPNVADTLSNLANLYRAQHRFEKAAPLFEEAAMIAASTLGLHHSKSKVIIENVMWFRVEHILFDTGITNADELTNLLASNHELLPERKKHLLEAVQWFAVRQGRIKRTDEER